MTPNRQIFTEELKLHGFSPNSIDVYVRAVRQLSEHFSRNPAFLSDEELRSYLLHLQKKSVAASTYNVAVVAIQHFFQYCTPKRPAPKINQIPVPLSLPEVFSVEETKRLLNSVTSLKYKAIFSLMYSAGLRIGECVNLQPSDIDNKRMLVHVKNAKGKKDRYTIMGNSALLLLREYYKTCKPTKWLFEGAKKGSQLHIRNIQKIFKQAVCAAGIKKTVTPHTLRHSFATHLLEQKCPLPAIQKFLGHKNIQSTLIYTHVSPKTIADIINPLDALGASTTTGENND